MITIRAMRDSDADAVLAIYQAGIDEGNATFETTVPTWQRFVASRPSRFSWVAVGDDDQLLGWVAASPVSARPCYAGVIEHSVYVHPKARGRGVGALLLRHLIETATADGVWTIQSSIFGENQASLRLHTAAGFRLVGRRERIAVHHGRWRDTLLIEYRRPDDQLLDQDAADAVG